MALATTCPHCHTSFKVVADQLKLRKGKVRCGVCKQVFAGDEHLRQIDEPAVVLATPVRPVTSVRRATTESTGQAMASPSGVPAQEHPEQTAPPIPTAIPTPLPPQQQPEEAFATPTQTTEVPTQTAEAPAPITEASAPSSTPRPKSDDWGLRRSTAINPEPDAASEPKLFVDAPPGDEDAIDFFAPNRKARGFSTRGAIFAALISIILALTLLLQLGIASREWLAARAPALRPALSMISAPFGLTVEAPRELAALTIESFELQAAGEKGLFLLTALIRNANRHSVRWPAMELSLNATQGGAEVRKVLLPAEYLAPDMRESAGIAPSAEQSIRVGLRTTDIEATGYSVRLFYP